MIQKNDLNKKRNFTEKPKLEGKCKELGRDCSESSSIYTFVYVFSSMEIYVSENR